MTKYFTNFEDSDIDDNPPAGWTERLAAGVTPSNFAHLVQQGSPVFKRREVKLTNSASGLGMLGYDAVNSDANRANVEVVAAVRLDSPTPDSDHVILVRASGTSSATAYYCSITSIDVRIGKVVAGAFTTLGTSSFSRTAGSTYLIRFRANSTSLQLRVWLAGSSEPSTWQVSVTDSAITAAGWVGFSGFTSGRVSYWNFFSVATNGDTAALPVLNTEYQAYLENSQNRVCVLAELAATGYDSGGAPYTKTVRAYLSSEAYVSAQQDSPSSTQYQPIMLTAPTFRREMGEALYGEASTGFGELVISNPVDPATGAGVRDNMLRCKWQAESVQILLGAPTWPRHDFRLVVLGRVGQPVSTTPGLITFGISGLTDMLDIPLQTNYFGSGVTGLANQQKPLMVGAPLVFEPVLIDEVTNQYQMHDGAIVGEPPVYDDGVEIRSTNTTISAVDAGTDTITTAAAHGLLPGYAVSFSGSAPPAPLASSTYYWVKTTPSTTTFTLSATEGGATINITTTATGATVEGWGWWPVANSPDGTFKLAAPAAGRVFVAGAPYQSPAPDSAYPANMLEWLVFTKGGISANYKDASTFAALEAALTNEAGIWFGPGNAVSVKDALFQVAQGTFCWAGWSPDGLLQVGQIKLPTTSPAQTFDESDVLADSLVLRKVLLPVDMSKSDVVVGRMYLRGGPLGAYRGEFQSEFSFDTRHTYAATTPPLDDDPTLAERRRGQRFETLFNATGFTGTLATLYGKKLGIFEVTINHLGPATLSIGDTIRLTHARLGWKQWSSLEASPDNSTSVDSRHAVVLGQETNLQGKTVRLTLLRQMPGYYPESDFTP